MHFQVVNQLPDSLVKDLPVEVLWALDGFLDDKQSMYHATERFIAGVDMLPGTYSPLIRNIKARKNESLLALKMAVTEYYPQFNLPLRLSEIGFFFAGKEKIKRKIGS